MATSTLDMHREHTAWQEEDELWRDDLAVWEQEINRAIKDLRHLQEALQDHAQTLRQHAASVRLYEQDFAACEHSLATHERGETNPPLRQLASAHKRIALKHSNQRKAHEQMKHCQHQLMAKWNLLVSAVLSTNPECPLRRVRKSTKNLR